MSTATPPRMADLAESRHRDTAIDRRARIDAGFRVAAGSALWLSLLLVSYWWAAGGGISDLAGWHTGLDSLGRLTGLIASNLLLVQVLLMARLPILEQAFGQDQLARIHRLVGLDLVRSDGGASRTDQLGVCRRPDRCHP